MNLFRVDLDQLTYQDVVDFCSQGIQEGVRVEYKRQLSTTQPERQLTKAVSALANTQGGILVYGVGTFSGGRHPEWPSDGRRKNCSRDFTLNARRFTAALWPRRSASSMRISALSMLCLRRSAMRRLRWRRH